MAVNVLSAGAVSLAGDGVDVLLSPQRSTSVLGGPPDRAQRPPGSRARALLLRAARQALEGPSRWWQAPPQRRAVVIGTACGGLDVLEATWPRIAAGEAPEPAVTFDDATGALAREVGAEGFVVTVAGACASGAAAVLLARELLLSGQVDVALAGGVDTVPELVRAGFERLRLWGGAPLRPFDARSAGTALTEGAACLLLGPGGADGIEVSGGWVGVDGHGLVDPDPSGEGLARVIAAALQRTGLDPDRLHHLSLHGSGTAAGDRSEARALGKILKGRGSRPALVALKAQIGHSSGACGALELAASWWLLRGHHLPPGWEPDHPIREWSELPGPREGGGDASLSINAGFGGIQSATVLRRGGSPAAPALASCGAFVAATCLVPRPSNGEAVEWLEAAGVPVTRALRRIDALGALAVLAGRGCAATTPPAGLGLVVVSGLSTLAACGRWLTSLREDAPNPVSFPCTAPSAPLGWVAQVVPSAGPALSLIGGEATRLMAVGWALDRIAASDARAMLIVEVDDPPPWAGGLAQVEPGACAVLLTRERPAADAPHLGGWGWGSTAEPGAPAFVSSLTGLRKLVAAAEMLRHIPSDRCGGGADVAEPEPTPAFRVASTSVGGHQLTLNIRASGRR